MSKSRSSRRNKQLSAEELQEIEEFVYSKNAEEDKVSINIKCKTEGQKELVNSIKSKEVTICSGLAGTGKTFLACAEALKLLKRYPNKYQKIVLVKSVTTLKDEEIGYLKGGLEDKMEPFMYSYMHNFEKILKNKQIVAKMKEHEMIQIMPIAYMRGINLDNSIVIIDEAQNLTKDHIITILTRLGSDSKMIFLGDRDQIDRKKKYESGLEWMIEKFKNFEEIGTVVLGVYDVVRNSLVSKILEYLKKVDIND